MILEFNILNYNSLHVLVTSPFPQNLSVFVGIPFSRGSGMITKSFVQSIPDSATNSVPIKTYKLIYTVNCGK